MVPRTSKHPKEETFNFRIDPMLKSEFQAATEADDRPAAQVLRDFMRAYVERRKHRDFAAEALRQSASIAARAGNPSSDEAAVMRELDDNFAELSDDWT
jgi:hypothetical protein